MSPLFGNLLLLKFDQEINARNVTCLRYIDDYIVIGAERQVLEAFKHSVEMLKELKLDVYGLNEDKAEKGLLKKGVNFLGCYIQPGVIRPSVKSKEKLLSGISSRLQESLLLMRSKDKYEPKKHSLCAALAYVRFKVKGWADAYRFCNDKAFFDHTEKKILKLIRSYIVEAQKIICSKRTSTEQAFLMGVNLFLPKAV